MSPKSFTETSGSSNHIGVILLDTPARAMDPTEYAHYLTLIIAEDGNLDCVPPGVMFINMNRGAQYMLWYLPEYILEKRKD